MKDKKTKTKTASEKKPSTKALNLSQRQKKLAKSNLKLYN